MAVVIKVRKVGNSLGVILTKDVVEALGVAEGDDYRSDRSFGG
jgi:putative addiction module antidote